MDSTLQRYLIETWPEPGTTNGMRVVSIEPGIKVTDLQTGRSACCNQYRHQRENRDAAIQALRLMEQEVLHEQ